MDSSVGGLFLLLATRGGRLPLFGIAELVSQFADRATDGGGESTACVLDPLSDLGVLQRCRNRSGHLVPGTDECSQSLFDLLLGGTVIVGNPAVGVLQLVTQPIPLLLKGRPGVGARF